MSTEYWDDNDFISEANFQKFLDSGRSSVDIGKDLGLEGFENVEGRIYMESLYIEGREGEWVLEIENQCYTSAQGYSLYDLEATLFSWAEADGYFE